MANNRIARGIVLVPCVLLGGAFLATAAWGQGTAETNRGLAATIGTILLLAGGLSQWRTSDSESESESDPALTIQDDAEKSS